MQLPLQGTFYNSSMVLCSYARFCLIAPALQNMLVPSASEETQAVSRKVSCKGIRGKRLFMSIFSALKKKPKCQYLSKNNNEKMAKTVVVIL